MKIRFNAPVILTYSIACTVIFIIGQVAPGFMNLFVVPGNTMAFNVLSLDGFRLVSYILGHGSWEHLIGNLSFVLLIGPVLEEKYGSIRMIVMILVTALATGIFNALLLPNPSLGASGIVFMLVLLISMTNVRKGEIPITLFAIIAIFLVKEIYNMIAVPNNINEEAHLLGGLFGGLFGFIFAREKKQKEGGATPSAPIMPETGDDGLTKM